MSLYKKYYEEDEMWCCKCEIDTMHLCHYDDHERDSSGDFFVCTKCRWAYNGYSGEYDEPDEYTIGLISEWEKYKNEEIG